MPSDDDYLLGRTAEEFERLARQAALLEPETEDLFRRAGIAAGMNVLEIGSGAGDVAMLVGRLVGPEGSVLGIERSAESAALAAQRVAAVGNLPVRFEVSDLDGYTPKGRFDALVGRFVLPYLGDPPATLRRLASHVRPGGAVAFLEFDVTKIDCVPEGPLFRKVGDWMVRAFADGINPALGSTLASVFRDAGLPWPQMLSFQKTCCGPDGFYWLIAETIRAVLPHILRLGLATEEEVDIDSLAERLRDEAVAGRMTVFSPRWVGAWVRV